MTSAGTPLMQQYREIKARHRDAILLFRMGDFYEMFYEDAELASRVLGLTLTSRNNGGASDVPLAGVPVKALQEYLRRLVQHGLRVAICEQVEDPKLAKGIVRREVVETITPGAALYDDLLDGARHNFLCAIYADQAGTGIAAADVSTGAFHVVHGPHRDASAAVTRFAPRELLIARGNDVLGADAAIRFDGVLLTEREPWEFDASLAHEELTRQFSVHSLEGFGIGSGVEAAIGAAGALLRYARELQPSGVPHLMRPRFERSGDCMPLDEMTRRNLELVDSLRGDSSSRGDRESSGTLLGVLDRTLTPMGARLLRQWLLAPLLAKSAIAARLDGVESLVESGAKRDALRRALDGVRDIERLAGKVAAGRSTPRELGALGGSLAGLTGVRTALDGVVARGMLDELISSWDDGAELAKAIQDALVDRPPYAIGDEDTIRPGFDTILDELRSLRDGGKDAIARIQTSERERTGIASLKVGYNRVFGYYIEVTNSNRHLIPDDYQRRQTLTGAERFVTPSLKEYEERVLTANERIDVRERELFERLRSAIALEVARIQGIASRVARLDVFAALAEVAVAERYSRPDVTEGFALEVVGARHPVVERMMPRERFIPNDISLTTDARMMIVTGPNMAGKSTILRQTGLIQLMAQMGSFVPAARAHVGIVDRLFTRVGASDNLVRGQSTFMVEMAETSAILHHATERSLVLLDEIGRGTSTFDGVSIAWAVSEHIHDHVKCKTIFATHYHELTQLSDELPALRNFNVAVREIGDEVLFLHRLQPGGADRSYGIEVGRLAGLPSEVIARARTVLRSLEGEQLAAALEAGSTRRRYSCDDRDIQLGLFARSADAVVRRLLALDLNTLTPLDALKVLDELCRDARQK